jgi:methenyltetrahydromethanopterin cyclohydrolase
VKGIGWTNDCILYGARAYYAVRAADEEVAAIIERLPASASPDYGMPFADIFKRYGHDFYKIDPMLFSPAEVTINNLATGRVWRAGRLNGDVLRGSLGVE